MAGSNQIILNESVNEIRNVEWLLKTITPRHFEDDKKWFFKTKKYLERFLKEDYQTITYETASSSPFGRLFGNGIQNIPNNIRGFLCDGLTTDLDFKNCHPTILYYICIKHKIKCSFLTEYITKRDEILDTLSTELNKSRDDIKLEIIKAINNENHKLENTGHVFLMNFGIEIKKIQNKLYNIDEYEWVVDEVKKDNKKQFNFKGSFISHLCCFTENNMLISLYDFLIKKNYDIHSLMFDGLMIYGNHYEDVELLKECNELIKEKFGEYHGVTYKAHATHYKIPDDYKTKKEIEEEEYKKLKEKFELTNFKMADQYGNVTKSGVKLYPKANFMILHEETYNKKFFEKWFIDSNKKTYETFGCYPKECPDNYFNLWTPFECIEYEPAEDDKGLFWFLNHVNSMCNYDDEVYKFVIIWLAQMVQYPETKSVQLVFQGKEGSGKGLFLLFLRTMLGSKKVYECSDPQNQIFGNQNGLLKDAFLVVFEEMEKSFFNKALPKLKTLITDPTIVIKELYERPFEMNSYHRYIGFTNKMDQILLDRRQVFIEGSSDKVNNTEYFSEGYGYAKDPKVAKKIYDYLMECYTEEKISKNHFPETEYQQELKETNRDSFDVWIEASINEYEEWTPVSEIYKNYRDWYRTNGFNMEYFNCNTIQFGMKLNRSGLMRKRVQRLGKEKFNQWIKLPS